MEFLSDDATYLAGALGLVGVVFLVVLRATQQGKYLIRALIAFGVAALVLVVEMLWVTESERIEQVVYGLKDAVAASDPEKVFVHLTPDVSYVQGGDTLSGEATRAFIKRELGRAKFDFVRIARLEANAGSQSGRGSAVFRVIASGSYEINVITYNFAATSLDFSLGLRQVEPRVWKVDRITLTQPPREMPSPGGNSKDTRPRIQITTPPGFTPSPGPGGIRANPRRRFQFGPTPVLPKYNRPSRPGETPPNPQGDGPRTDPGQGVRPNPVP